MIEFCYQDKIKNSFIPNGTPPFIIDKMRKIKKPISVFDNGGFQEEVQLEIGISTFRHILELLQYSNIDYKECLIEERTNEKYFFPISSFGSAEGMLGISEGQINYEFTKTFSNQVISDIRENKCKVLLDGIDEGMPFKKEWCDKLHELIDDLELSRKSFYFSTSNNVFKDWYDKNYKKNKQINILKFNWAETSFQENCIEAKLNNEKFLSHKRNKHYISLNRSPREHRKKLFDYLKLNKLLDCGYVSYVAENYFVDREYSLGASDNPCWNFIDKNFIEDSYFNIVTETWFYEKSLLLTEKIFKSVIYFQPFLLFGGYNSLKLLKDLGYKTFSRIFDESYDDEEDNDKRFEMICNEINRIGKIPISDIHEMYLSVEDILEYNYKHFLTKKQIDYGKLFNG